MKAINIQCEQAISGVLDHPGFFWTEGSTPDGKDGWDGFMCPRCHADESMRAQPCARHFTTDPATTSLLLAEIERQGLQEKYAWEILDIAVGSVGGYMGVAEMEAENIFRLIRATPEQHARAFIAATQVP